MTTPARARLRGGPITPGSIRDRRSQPPDAELPVLDTAQNRLYGSSIPVLPNDSETGSRLEHGSLASNMARTRGAASVRSLRSEQVTRDRDRSERQSNRELIREGSVTSHVSKAGTRKERKNTEALVSYDDSAAPRAPGSGFVPSMRGGLRNSSPPDGDRPLTGETASKTWGQETGINAQAVTGVGQDIPLGGAGGADTTAYPGQQAAFGEGSLAHDPSHADSNDGGPLGSEDSGDSDDELVFSRRHQLSKVQHDSRPWLLKRFVLPVLVSILLLPILWGSIMKGSDFSLASYLTSGVGTELKELRQLLTNHSINDETLKELRQLLTRHAINEETLKTLVAILPELTVVYRDTTGEIMIHEDFWLALRSKIQSEFGGLNSGSKEAGLWDRFLELNESRMRPYIANAVDEHILKARADGVLVTKEQFLLILQANYEQHSQAVAKIIEDKYIGSISKDLERKVSKAAMQKVEAIWDGFSRALPAAQLEALVQTNIDRSSQQALASVNYFSPGMGAITDLRIASATHTPKRSRGNWFLSLFLPIGRYPTKGPSEVLYGWEEPLDCWCTSNKSNAETLGNAQFGVIVATHIYPTNITVEHIPRTAVPSVRNAPKDMELWVNILDSTMFDIVKEESEAVFGPTPPRSVNMGNSWLRIGTWRYTPYGIGHVQTFPLQVDLEQMGAPGKEFMIRATTNWGSAFTCFYRVRMGGKAADPSVWEVQGKEVNRED